MRTFIGIDFNDTLKNELSKFQETLKEYAIKGRWKYPENLHLTLKFLGDIDINQKAQIDTIIKDICKRKTPLNLNIKGIGAFNGKGSIRVLWLGIEGDIPVLQALYNEIEDKLIPLGFSKEKRVYKPHITIGQDIIFNESNLKEFFNKLGHVDFGNITVDTVYSFKSEHIANKLKYTQISKYDLLND